MEDEDEWIPAGPSRGRVFAAASLWRKTHHKRGKKEGPNLDMDSLAHIMQFLAPKPLMAFASTYKTLSAKLTIDMAVKSALVNGMSAVIVTFADLLESHLVHLPSPLRLLKLVDCFQRGVFEQCPCEFCRKYDEYAFGNLDEYGVIACDSCVDRRLRGIVQINESLSRGQLHLGRPIRTVFDDMPIEEDTQELWAAIELAMAAEDCIVVNNRTIGTCHLDEVSPEQNLRV